MVKHILLTITILLTLSASAFAEGLLVGDGLTAVLMPVDECLELKKENIKLKLSLLEQQGKLMQGQYEQLAKELKELEQVK